MVHMLQGLAGIHPYPYPSPVLRRLDRCCVMLIWRLDTLGLKRHHHITSTHQSRRIGRSIDRLVEMALLPSACLCSVA